MNMVLELKNKNILRSILLLCLIPYFGMLLYLILGLHTIGDQAHHVSTPFMLLCLAFVGGLIPAFGIIYILRNLLSNKKHFELRGILEAYASLIIIFASWYSLLQVQSHESAFEGMRTMWLAGKDVSLMTHISHLHSIFLDSLYLSIMTITTVGFGDMVPLTTFGKILTASESLIGVGFLGVVLGHYFSVCIHHQKK